MARPKKVAVGLKYDAQIDKEGDYKLTAFISNKEQVIKGKTLGMCLEKLKTDNIAKGKCVLKVEKGELKSDMILSPAKIKRLYFNKNYRDIIEKQLNLRLT